MLISGMVDVALKREELRGVGVGGWQQQYLMKSCWLYEKYDGIKVCK